MKKFVFKPRNLLSLAGILSSILTTLPSYAAEKIDLKFGPVIWPVSVKSLETFATQGKVESDVALLLNRLSPQRKKQLQSFLTTSYPINSLTLHQLGGSYAGHRVLNFVGNVVQIPGGRNGYYGIRAGMIQAAADPKGLTVINFLHKFPTPIVQIDVAKGLQLLQEANQLGQETRQFVHELSQISASDEHQSLVDTSNNPFKSDENLLAKSSFMDLRQLGQLNTFKQTRTFFDPKRNRKIIVDLYLPKNNQAQLPVIVITNGLGANRDRFEELADHLASHGFAVVIPDHPGSNAQRQQDFYQGYYKEPFDGTEYIDRPLDVTYVLDQLEQLNSSQYNNQLNLQQVGIFGNSLGGTTALALAGATIDFKQLKQDCDENKSLINISIVHQCLALELPQKNYSLKDSRIKAAYVFVPFGRSLYGKSGISQIDIPIFWQASDEDLITPLLIEQTPTYSWLTTSDKYFSIAEKLPHTRIGLNALNRIMDRQLSVEKLLQLTQNYLSALNLAFFKVYVAQDEQYRPYLQQSYADRLTEKPYNLIVIKSIDFSESYSLIKK